MKRSTSLETLQGVLKSITGLVSPSRDRSPVESSPIARSPSTICLNERLGDGNNGHTATATPEIPSSVSPGDWPGPNLKASSVRWFIVSDSRDVQRKPNTLTTVDGTRMILRRGCLFSRGNNTHGQCGVDSPDAWVDTLTQIQVPPVTALYYGAGGFIAMTRLGVHVWGANPRGRLGVPGEVISEPVKALNGLTIDNVNCCPDSTFLRTPDGWLATGAAGKGATPRLIAGPDVHWCWGQDGAVFEMGPNRLRAMGDNESGQLGVSRADAWLTCPAEVDLPPGVARTVTEISVEYGSTFIRCGSRCFVCGLNTSGQLGVGSNGASIFTPVELTFPVTSVATDGVTTMFLSNGGLRVSRPRGGTVVLDTPGPISRLAMRGGVSLTSTAFLLTGTGKWYTNQRDPGRGIVGVSLDSWVEVPGPDGDARDSKAPHRLSIEIPRGMVSSRSEPSLPTIQKKRGLSPLSQFNRKAKPW